MLRVGELSSGIRLLQLLEPILRLLLEVLEIRTCW
jgi:hypothetical protein